MKTFIEYESERFRLVNFGNGWAYTLINLGNGKSLFFQDDDARQFDSDYESACDAFDSIEIALKHVWNEYEDIAQLTPLRDYLLGK